MDSPYRLAEVAAMLADSSRAAMLASLLDGSARPAGELAATAGVSAATASAHLARLIETGLLRVEPRGRHRYFRLAGPRVADALEALGRLLPDPGPTPHPARLALREARLCYDHLAGRLGVAIADALVDRRWTAHAQEGFRPTAAGARALGKLGLDLDELTCGRRTVARACLDWTERREHVAGALGAALASLAFERGWVVRRAGTRALRVTTVGRAELARRFSLELAPGP